jgi:hypothetical protein
MTGVIILGGLGNMLFGLATGETWRKNGVDVVYTNIDTNFIFLTENGCTKIPPLKYQYIFENFDWNAHKCPKNTKLPMRHVPFRYTEFKIGDNIQYHGFFQSEKNFPDHAFIRQLFEPSDEIKNELNKYNHLLEGITCSVHVRRGDYVRLSDLHPVQGMDYYNKACQVLEPQRIGKYLIFSDDIPWCRENFKHHNCVFIEDVDYIELFLMGRTTHHIIGNSSYSWWGAWLGEKEGETVVVAPKLWMTKQNMGTDDIIPDRWIKI